MAKMANQRPKLPFISLKVDFNIALFKTYTS